MDIDLARKLLGVDGSNLLTLETAWHDRRNQILQQQLTGSEAEIREHEALLANLDRARQVLQEAAAMAEVAETDPEAAHTNRRTPTIATGIWLGVIAGVAVATALIVLIAALAGHLHWPDQGGERPGINLDERETPAVSPAKSSDTPTPAAADRS